MCSYAYADKLFFSKVGIKILLPTLKFEKWQNNALVCLIVHIKPNVVFQILTKSSYMST